MFQRLAPSATRIPISRARWLTQRLVARVRRVYANRREILANSLRRTFGEGFEFTLAGGGMALWVRVRMSVDVEGVSPAGVP